MSLLVHGGNTCGKWRRELKESGVCARVSDLQADHTLTELTESKKTIKALNFWLGSDRNENN